jgi:hypothetical protein
MACLDTQLIASLYHKHLFISLYKLFFIAKDKIQIICFLYMLQAVLINYIKELMEIS